MKKIIGSTKKAPRAGRQLEKLVALVEKVLLSKFGVSVDSPGYLIDRVTRDAREHDVLLTFNAGHHSTSVAIECRDKSRKVCVNDVESFVQKTRDTGVSKACIVSAKGFSKSALDKARHHQIDCLTIDRIASFNWISFQDFEVLSYNVKSFDWTFQLHDQSLLVDMSDFEVLRDGEVVDIESMKGGAMEQFNILSPDQLRNGAGRVSIIFPSPNLYLRSKVSDLTAEVQSAVVAMSYDELTARSPVELREYRNVGSETTIASIAQADVDVVGFEGKLLMVNSIENGTDIYFVKR